MVVPGEVGAFEVWDHPGESPGSFIFKGSQFVNLGRTAIFGQFASSEWRSIDKNQGHPVPLGEPTVPWVERSREEGGDGLPLAVYSPSGLVPTAQ